jgi:hypothetical protein
MKLTDLPVKPSRVVTVPVPHGQLGSRDGTPIDAQAVGSNFHKLAADSNASFDDKLRFSLRIPEYDHVAWCRHDISPTTRRSPRYKDTICESIHEYEVTW